MAEITQFWFAAIILGMFILGVLWGPATALEGAVIYLGLLVTGIFLTKLAARRMGL